MKFRKHHNNKGLKQIRTGNTRKQVGHMANRLFKRKFKPTMKRRVTC